MTFPNAFQGVKKLFTSEILKLIATLCALIGSIAGVLTIAAAVNESNGGVVGGSIATVVLGLGATVLLLIAYILKLIGLKKAGNDEPRFAQAFIIAIFALILAVVSGILGSLNVGNGVVDTIFQILANVAEIIITVFVIQGIQNLAEKLNQHDIAETGSKLQIIIIVFYVLAIIASVLPLIFGANPATATISSIIAIVGAVLNLIAYIVFLVYLSKAKNMLAQH